MPYKVLVVDDSALMRSEITKIIEQDPELQVVATAINGSHVMDKIKRYQPDVITMDINMPVMDGIEALKLVMAENPLPVVMISSLTQEGADETIEALSHGAFDFIGKPSGAISRDIDSQGEMIRQKIKLAASSPRAKKLSRKLPVGRSTHFQRQADQNPPPAKPEPALGAEATGRPALQGTIVGIGVSTGGPKTLMSILPEIPASFNGCVIIAQHMPEKFTLSFANRLNRVCPLTVKEAEDGEIAQTGTIYIAPGGKHLRIRVRNGRLLMLETIDEAPGKIYKPSVDVLFESMLEELGSKWLGVMLTGMGSDGSKPLTELFKKGGHTIVESEESCVVFGMPGKVVALGGAEFILPEDQIVPKILEVTGSR